MKKILAGCSGIFGLWLFSMTAQAQPTLTFANSGTGWVGPWYGLGGETTSLVISERLGYPVLIGNSLLAGPGFTAELWAGPEGSSSSAQLQPQQQTTFRTGAAAGQFLTPSPTPVPFAQPGQRIAYQLRVWDNVNGTVASWAHVLASQTMPFGMTDVFLSPPLASGTTTLEFRDGYTLSLDGNPFRLPLISVGLDETTRYLTRGAYEGDNVMLAVECPNNPATTVQWLFHGTNLDGQTNLTLHLPQISPAQAGLYSAAVTVVLGSRIATMTNTTEISLLAPPRLAQPRFHAQNGFSATIEGVTNRNVQIDSSSNLVSWTPGQTQYIGFAGHPCFCLQNSFTNSFPLPATAHFYRARVLP